MGSAFAAETSDSYVKLTFITVSQGIKKKVGQFVLFVVFKAELSIFQGNTRSHNRLYVTFGFPRDYVRPSCCQ